jgi:EF hand
MLRRTNIVRAIVAIAVLVATWAILGTAIAQKAAVPKPQDKLALGENEVKQLLLIMDTDENGKISKQEWMKFMEAEFDRLDKDKKGQLDAMELTQSKLCVSHVVNVGKKTLCATVPPRTTRNCLFAQCSLVGPLR